MSAGRKKILFIIPALRNGGTEKVAYTLFNNLDDKKFNKIFLILDRVYSENFTLSKDFVELHKPNVLQSALTLRREINAQKPDIIVGFIDHLNVLLALFKKLRFIKATLILRSSVVLSDYLVSQKKRHISLLSHLFYKTADLIICQSKYMMQDFKNNFGVSDDQLRLLYNPIDLNHLTRRGDEAMPISFHKNRFNLVAVGNLRKEKSYLRMIEGFALLKKDKFHLYIVGEGVMRNEIEGRIKELQLEASITLLGNVENPLPIIKNADLFITSSSIEGYSNSVIEAFCFEKPVIAFADLPGVAELVQDGENGFLATSSAGYAACIEKASVMEFNREAFRFILQRHELKTCMSEFNKILLNA